MLSQLSYSPVKVFIKLTEEKPIGQSAEARNDISVYQSPHQVKYSDQLLPVTHTRLSMSWWAWIELNYRPRAYQARALTN